MIWLALATASPRLLVRVDEPLVMPQARCFAHVGVCVVEGVPAEDLKRMPGVKSVEPDRQMVLAGSAVSGSTECPDPHELVSIHAADAWVAGRGSGVLVAVQDAGFRTSHVDLAGQIVDGWDYGDNDNKPQLSPADVPEHGTFVAGIVAAVDDGVGRTGVAPEAELFVQKIADRTGALYFSYAIEAMDALVGSDVKVLNYSIASLSPPQAFEDAVSALGAADVLVVTAAANCPVPNCGAANNDTNPVFPANYAFDHVVAVASQVLDGSLDAYSHFGATSVELAAPGADVCSLGVQSDEDWVVASGTSYATPVVAGVAALMRGAYPRLTAAQTAQLLCDASVQVPALAGKVRCGAVDALTAMTTPVPQLGELQDVAMVVGEATDWVLLIDNLAGAGVVTVGLEGLGDSLVGDSAFDVMLVADGVTEVVVPIVRSSPGDIVVTVTVSGVGGEATGSVTMGATEGVVDPVQTADTSVVVDTGSTPTAPPAGTTNLDPSGCGCQSSTGLSWWVPSRRR